MAGAVLAMVNARTAGGGGGGPPRVQLSAQNVDSTGTGSRNAGIRMNTSGILQSRIQGAYATLQTWLLTGASSDYEVMCVNPNGFGTGTFNTWVACNTSPEWYLTDAINDGSPNYDQFQVSIRDATTLAVLVSNAQMDINASRI